MIFRLSIGVCFCFLLMLLIWALGPYSADIEFIPDQGALWYYWKRPDPNFWTRLSAWGLYIAHQITIWWLIYSAKNQQLSYKPNSSSKLHRVNIYALTANLFFVVFHIIQTKFLYDGLAQDVSNLSAQFSVIFLLSFVLIIENKRRGILLGKRLKLLDSIYPVIKEYHGYYFAWAVIYTFWFHPIEITLGHLLGTFYVLMLLLQGSLFFTRFHTNKKWTVLLEMFVLIHGTLIAYLNVNSGSPSMFAFGFLTLFFVNQLYGLTSSKKVISLLTMIYAFIVVAYYWQDLQQAQEIIRIPMALYIGVAFIVLLYFIGCFVKKIIKSF